MYYIHCHTHTNFAWHLFFSSLVLVSVFVPFITPSFSLSFITLYFLPLSPVITKFFYDACDMHLAGFMFIIIRSFVPIWPFCWNSKFSTTTHTTDITIIIHLAIRIVWTRITQHRTCSCLKSHQLVRRLLCQLFNIASCTHTTQKIPSSIRSNTKHAISALLFLSLVTLGK